MTIEELLLYDLSKEHTTQIGKMAIENTLILEELWKISISADEPQNWRAAWVLKIIWEQNPALILPYVEKMQSALPKITKGGVKREFLKVISENPVPSDEERLGVLLDTCFKWLADPLEPIAIKIHSINILFEISKMIPEIIPELKTTIEVVMQEGSAGIINRGSRTLRALQKMGRT